MAEGDPNFRRRSIDQGLVYEAPRTKKVEGDKLTTNDYVFDPSNPNGKPIKIRQILSHGTDETMVILSDSSSRIFSNNRQEAEILEEPPLSL